MKIYITVIATGIESNTAGSADISLDVPDHTCFLGVGDTVNLAIEQAIDRHNAKLAELKAEQEQEKLE